MAPIQKTFSVIPDFPVGLGNNGNADAAAGRPSRPPMTTKQAKKLYKAANRGPKLSKAEQRRLELMEQDRIRVEIEKERNQARAQKARDKRKEKEDRQKTEKRKKGLPLVDVRPSQDTIARFVRKAKAEKSETGPAPLSAVAEDDSDSTLLARDDSDGRPSKRRRTSGHAGLGGTNQALNLDMFQVANTKTMDLHAKPSSNLATKGLEKEPSPKSCSVIENGQTTGLTPKPCSFNVDDASTKDLVDQQLWNESFTSEDWAFVERDCGAEDAEKPPVEDPNAREKLFSPLKPLEPEQCLEPEITRNLASNTTTEATKVCATSPPSSKNMPANKCGMEKVPPEEIHVPGAQPKEASVVEAVKANVTPQRVLHHVHASTISESAGSVKEGERPSTKATKYPTPDPNFKAAEAKKTRQPIPQIVHVNMTHGMKGTTHRPSPAQVSVREALADVSSNRLFNTTPTGMAQLSANGLGNGTKSAVNTPRQNQRKPKVQNSASRMFSLPTVPMGPRPPPKFNSTGRPIHHTGVSPPNFLPQNGIASILPPPARRGTPAKPATPHTESMAPPSTQMFLLNFHDMLFPSPSQEVRELFDDCDPQPLTPFRSKVPSPPSRPVPRAHEDGRGIGGSRNDGLNNAIPTGFPNSGPFDPIPFLSTQDLFMSSQEIMELEEQPTSMTRDQHSSISQAPEFTPSKPSPGPSRRSPKPFFTSSGTTEMVALAKERSKTSAWKDAHARRIARETEQSLEDETERLLLEAVVEDDALSTETDNDVPSIAEETASQQSDPLQVSERPQYKQPRRQDSKDGSQWTARSRQRSSWEAMLDLLKKDAGEQVVISSQETDYGDEDLEDGDWCGILEGQDVTTEG